jgi:hypothetical protein
MTPTTEQTRLFSRSADGDRVYPMYRYSKVLFKLSENSKQVRKRKLSRRSLRRPPRRRGATFLQFT